MDDARKDLFQLIRLTPKLTWQLLTKRIERVRRLLPADWGSDGWPNVWIGTSIENQKYADQRLPVLRKIPAVVRFASYEPALGPIDFDKVVAGAPLHDRLDWLIYGAESGPNFRPDDRNWARQARRQCEAAGVSFFFKQGAGPYSGTDPVLDGEVIQNFPTPREVAAGIV
jgi:protein gp37